MTFTHGNSAFYLDHILVMNDPVKDTFGNGTVVIFGTVTIDAEIPVIRIVLSTEDQGTFPAAGFNDLQKIVCFGFGKRAQEPLIDDQQVKLCIGSLYLVLCIQGFGDSKLIEQIRRRT